MSGYTPGPWVIGGCRQKVTVGGYKSDSHLILADGPDFSQESVALVYYSDRNGLHGETFANARLIASAPTMLSALEAAQPIVCKATCSGDDHSAECLHITATLAEAKGGDA